MTVNVHVFTVIDLVNISVAHPGFVPPEHRNSQLSRTKILTSPGLRSVSPEKFSLWLGPYNRTWIETLASREMQCGLAYDQFHFRFTLRAQGTESGINERRNCPGVTPAHAGNTGLRLRV